MAEQHSKEPWSVWCTDGGQLNIQSAGNKLVAWIEVELSETPRRIEKANARRIVACINACQGISTEALEAGAVAEMREALERALGGLRAWEKDQNEYHPESVDGWKLIEDVEAVLAKLQPKEEANAVDR